MSRQSVRVDFAARAPDPAILETKASSATVPEAAAARGVGPGQIGKTPMSSIGDRHILLVARGDARLDNREAGEAFGGNAKIVDAETTEAATGHPGGGIRPFGHATPLDIYRDSSPEASSEVIPAAGSRNAAARPAPSRLGGLTGEAWVDVCRPPE